MPSSSTSSSRLVLKCGLAIAPVIALLAAYLWAAPGVLARHYGPTAASQVERAFVTARSRSWNTLVLGNSRMYRGVNPALLPGPAFNFAHDEDGFNHAYYKLLYLKDAGVLPRRVLLGVDYFQFASLSSSRNHLYARWLRPEFLADYRREARDPWQLMRHADEEFNETWTREITLTFPHFLAALAREPRSVPDLRANGQLVVPARVTLRNPAYLASLRPRFRRDAARLATPTEYLQRLDRLCQEEHIELTLVTPPLNHCEKHLYPAGTAADFAAFLARTCPGVRWLNLADDPDFRLDDYSDMTHLTPPAADRFSAKLAAPE